MEEGNKEWKRQKKKRGFKRRQLQGGDGAPIKKTSILRPNNSINPADQAVALAVGAMAQL